MRSNPTRSRTVSKTFSIAFATKYPIPRISRNPMSLGTNTMIASHAFSRPPSQSIAAIQPISVSFRIEQLVPVDSRYPQVAESNRDQQGRLLPAARGGEPLDRLPARLVRVGPVGLLEVIPLVESERAGPPVEVDDLRYGQVPGA